MRRHLPIILLLCSLFSATASAQGTVSNDEYARELFALGQKHVKAGEYREAYHKFAAAYRLSKRPGFLFNMAECLRSDSDPEGAAKLYVRYLKKAPGGKHKHRGRLIAVSRNAHIGLTNCSRSRC